MKQLKRRRTVVLTACAFLAPICATLRAAGPQDPAADNTAYFYDGSGRRTLILSATEFVVWVADPAAARSGRPASLPAWIQPADPDESIMRLEAQLERRGLFVVRGMSRRDVLNLRDVRFALPLLYLEDSDVPIYPNERVALRLKAGADEAALRAAAEALGCDVERLQRGERRYLLHVRDVRAVDPLVVANTLHERADLVEYAHPDFFLPKVTYEKGSDPLKTERLPRSRVQSSSKSHQGGLTPFRGPPPIVDPYYLSHQWHLDGDTLKGADANSDINVETAWDPIHGATAEGSPTVRVSILDECVEKLHPDLFPNWAAGLDLDEPPYDDDPSPDAGQQHGTACAGVAVAAGNTIGVRGAAPRCGLIGVKFFGATVAEQAEGFYFSMDPNDDGDHSDGAAVLSNSWGYASGTLQPPEVVNAINTVATTGRNGKGCLVLFASANNDHTVNGVQALGQLQSVMAVGGTNSHAQHTEFSDVGPEVGIATPTNDRGDDGVRQPWLDITTVDNTGSSGYNGLPDLDYTNGFGGTSSATPLAAGILALIISQDETMTAAQARAILQHTAVRIDEPFGRFDPITGHSHRYGFGRADAGAAITAAQAGLRWPDRIRTMSVSGVGNDVQVTWSTPQNDYAGSLLVRSLRPFGWRPTDGETYTLGQIVAPGVEVVLNATTSIFTDSGATTGGFFYAAFPRSSANLYGFGGKGHIIRNGVTVLNDNSEGVDPGWIHGGAGDEWTRGTPTAANSAFAQSVTGSGPLAGLNGTRAIGGNKCWGTDLAFTYDANADAWLMSPVLNLTGVTAPVFLEYYDWCLLETLYDRCTLEVADPAGNLLGYLDDDTGGDYDWTRRVYDLTPFAGQPIRVRFRLTSDAILQRDGWFLDEIRVTVADQVSLPPSAVNVYAETTENTEVNVTLTGFDPNPGTTLTYVIASLPTHGTLSDPNGGAIVAVPYTLLGGNRVVRYTPSAAYQGPDAFIYHVNDGGLDSNDADVTLSVGTPLVAYDFPLNSDPGWLTEGQWAFGDPQGAGGDPNTGFTGLNVYGYNLAGQYGNNLGPEGLTTLPLNCTGLSRVTVKFARWLGVEAASFDNADIEATNDGENWQTVWSHSGGDLAETAWSQQSINIAAVADGQPFVQVRWVMGPTDSNTTFAGWNLDDIQVTAIGAPSANQPPLARGAEATTHKNDSVAVVLDATDGNLDSLDYLIESLPSDGTLSDPNGGAIAAVPYTLLAGGNTVMYAPDTDFAGIDAFSYSASDGALGSNTADATVEVIDSAAFPYIDTFEAGSPLAVHWSADSTATGRIRVVSTDGPDGAFHVTMDSGQDSTFALNELTLAVNLLGHSSVLLRYDWKDFGDETHALPATWQGSALGDGIGISADGVTWHRIANLYDGGRAAADDDAAEETATRADQYQTVTLDLDQAAVAAGLTYNKTFRIRFVQYDNFPLPTDGIALDNIQVLQGTGDPLITTASLPIAFVGLPYGPVALAASGGDLPLEWATLLEYFEEGLGTSEYAETGVPHKWFGDDAVFDYTLPFEFPFYGQSYTAIRVGTDGWINFGPHVGSTWNNSVALLSFNKRIAVLWDDLRTNVPGGDIAVDDANPGQVTIRWTAVTRSGLHPCNFSATLFDNGKVRLDYGAGNTPITATVGVSAGDQVNYLVSSYNAVANLGGADSLMFDFSQLPPGLSMDTSGIIIGTPTTPGVYQPLFEVTDQSQRTHAVTIPITVIPDIYGDFDLDGDADLADWTEFTACMEEIEPSPECVDAFDADADADVDVADYGMFQIAFTGALR